MSADLHLNLQKPGLLSRIYNRIIGNGRPVIAIAAPQELTKTKEGVLEKAPEGAWSMLSNYSSGDVDVRQIKEWLGRSLGGDILEAIGKLYPASPQDDKERLRVVLMSEKDFRADMMSTPWEVLESFNTPRGSLPYSERLSVVRVLAPQAAQPEPVPASNRIEVAVLWANPYSDIKTLGQHLEKLKKFFEDRKLELSLAGPFEFKSPDYVQSMLNDVHPHVVYYIGHALQRANQKVFLPIGEAGSEVELDVEAFRLLLQKIGPPRLLLLNACAGTIGRDLNPYLGAALGCAQDIDAVISMQTEMPVEAAIVFADGFFRKLASGGGTAESVKWGRHSIRQALVKNPALPEFTPYIPVLLQRTLQDHLFTIDLTGRELRYLLNYLRQDILPVAPYIKRRHDPEIDHILSPSLSAPRVSLIEGPSGSGKSTSVTQAISRLMNKEQYQQGNRYLYYKVQPQNLTGNIDYQINQLLISFAASFPILIWDLKAQLETCFEQRPAEALVRFASWLEEEERKERRYCICLDNIPSTLAQELAARAANLITQGGRLVLITEEAETTPNLPVTLLTVPLISADEIRLAMQDRGDPSKSDEDIRRLMVMSGGFPFFVADYLRRGIIPATSDDGNELGKSFLESFNPKISDEQMKVLRFAALVDVAIPAPIFAKLEEHFPQEAVRSLNEDHLLQKLGDDSYQLPKALRQYLLDTIEADFAVYFHQLAAGGFDMLAAENQDSQDEMTFQLVTRWFREAFQHYLACSQIEAAQDATRATASLAEARSIAITILHDRYLEVANETGAAISMWEQYREAASALEQYEDREGDLRYADCLTRVGQYEPAIELLEYLTQDDEVDAVQINAFILHNTILKNRGKQEDFSARVRLLERALVTARQLEEREPGAELPRKLRASVEHSFGNALGYGKNARPEEAIGHLDMAEKLFAELNSTSRFQEQSERIEIKRYNNLLTEEERRTAIATLLENRSKLITRASRRDAIMHSYELGRLELNRAVSASYFQDAFRRAGDIYRPINWLAAINWRRAQIEAQIVRFEEVAPELERYTEKLDEWRADVWNLRTLRETFYFLADNYQSLNRTEDALSAAERCWQTVKEIVNIGEGRKDPAHRAGAARIYGLLLLRQKQVEKARAVAVAVADLASSAAEPVTAASMNEAEFEQFFTRLEKGKTP